MELLCLKHKDLAAWEHAVVDPVLENLAKTHTVKVEHVDSKHRGILRRTKADCVWILCHRWRDALKHLGANPKVRTYVSVLNHPPRSALPTLFWAKFETIPLNTVLLTHSLINFRFYREIMNLREDKVGFLPLPFPNYLNPPAQKSDEPVFGTYSSLTSESNMHYFLSVSHYVVQKIPNAQIKIFGSGALNKHLAKLIIDLGLSNNVKHVDSSTLEDISQLDVFLYVPLQNDHFLTLMAAARAKLPVLCSDIAGIDRYVSHNQNGYVIPSDEVIPMGQLVTELLADKARRDALGARLFDDLAEKFSVDRIGVDYSELFFSGAQHRHRAA